MIPQAYKHTASAVRPFVEIRHAWYAEHSTPLGSCPDSAIIDALTPKVRRGREKPTSYDDYDVPTELPTAIGTRLKSFEDLCTKIWN